MRVWGGLAFGLAVLGGCAVPAIGPPLVSPLVSSLSPPPATLFHEPFNQLDPKRWREIEVKGRTEFTIEDIDGQRALKAHSVGAASILVCPIRFDPKTYPWVNWRWRVERLVDRENLATKAGSDAAARVYVYFNTPGLPWQKRNFDYVWSAVMPVGTMLPSAFAKTSVIIVLESGPQRLNTWQAVSRNIVEDYRTAFHAEPPDVLALGILTDADSTASEAVAYYDDLMITREPAYPTEPGTPPKCGVGDGSAETRSVRPPAADAAH